MAHEIAYAFNIPKIKPMSEKEIMFMCSACEVDLRFHNPYSNVHIRYLLEERSLHSLSLLSAGDGVTKTKKE